MYFQAGPSPGASGVTIEWVLAVGTATAGLGAIVGSWIAHRQGRKSQLAEQRADLQNQVSKEVDAKIGAVLISLRSLEADARANLAEWTTTLDRRQKELGAAVEGKETALRHLVESSVKQAQEVEGILQRASVLIPLTKAAELIPIQLMAEASSASDAVTKTACLQRILDHPDSNARLLESAGDIARQELMNTSLAARLYRRAQEVDPDAITAKAEYLALMAYVPTERSAARQQIVDLATTHPNIATVVNCVLNFFIRTHDSRGLLESATALLDVSSERGLLWRNIAVARMDLDMPPAQIEEAYENALQLGDEDDYVNAAHPYVGYLLRKGDDTRAEIILDRALRQRPLRGELHSLRGDLYRRRGQYDLAINSYQWAEKVGDQEDKIIARRLLREMEVLQHLGLTVTKAAALLPPSTSDTSASTDDARQ